MDNPYGYTVPLALEDYVPVLLSALGAALLVRAAATAVPAVRRTGYVGVALLLAGGAAKSTWKLIVASGGPDLPWLENALFPLLAFGFGLVAWALWSGLRGRVLPWWPLAALLAIAWIGADALRSLQPFFGAAVLLSLVVTGLAITWALRARDRLATASFVIQLIGVFGLVPLQRQEVQTLALQWGEQSINTIAQAAFAFGAWRVSTAAAQAHEEVR